MCTFADRFSSHSSNHSCKIASRRINESDGEIGDRELAAGIYRKSDQIVTRSRLPSSDESKRAQPTIRCHVDHALLLDISPTFFSPVNLFLFRYRYFFLLPRQQYHFFKFRFRVNVNARRIDRVSPLFIRRLIQQQFQCKCLESMKKFQVETGFPYYATRE